MNEIFDAIIIGGGYSGCIAAILLARASLKVAVIEKNNILCRKVLSTGNGRCNFSNDDMSKEHFFSNDSLDSFSFNTSNHIGFLRELGVIEKNINGYYYPYTNQAKTIRDAIDYEINNLKVKLFLDTQAKSIAKNEFYEIKTADNSLKSRAVIIATGGKSASSLGSTGDGYYFAKNFNIKTSKTVPSLVGLKSDDPVLKNLAGVRTLGNVTFDGHTCEGEIQFNKDGISGYPVMCISRFLALEENDKSLKLEVDFLPFFNSFELEKEINNRLSKGRPLYECLNGLTNEKCLNLAIERAKINKASNGNQLSDKQIKALINNLKHMTFDISGTKGFEASQVTAGGVLLSELNKNLMVKNSTYENLYFIGEVCDVDGICGGYNLQWAYESAVLASDNIIENRGR